MFVCYLNETKKIWVSSCLKIGYLSIYIPTYKYMYSVYNKTDIFIILIALLYTFTSTSRDQMAPLCNKNLIKNIHRNFGVTFICYWLTKMHKRHVLLQPEKNGKQAKKNTLNCWIFFKTAIFFFFLLRINIWQFLGCISMSPILIHKNPVNLLTTLYEITL